MSATPQPWVYAEHQCLVLQAIDGDTIEVEINLGFRSSTIQRFRLLGYNAPESRSSDATERSYGKIAWEDLSFRIAGRAIELRSWKADSFGRWLADVRVRGPEGDLVDLVEQLIAAGYGCAWNGKPPAPKPWLAWPRYPLTPTSPAARS